MAKRKTAESIEETGVQPQQETTRVDFPPTAEGETQETAVERKSTWLARFKEWIDPQAGVSLIEDRVNRRLLIKFEEKPSESVRALMKDKKHAYEFDTNDQVWWKKIDRAKREENLREARKLAFDAANLIRGEKGLEIKLAPFLGAQRQ